MKTLLDSYGFLIGKALQLLEDDFGAELKAYGMDSRQYGLLVKVYEKPNMSQIQIAQELKIDRTTMAERAERLEALNYITRVKSPQDKRTYCLNLSTCGIEILENCWELLNQSQDKILSPLSGEEKEQFKQSLLKIYTTWRNHENE
ncbi:MAG: MarR family winged helix-turn-helix transcriptional regulator [Peribacillus sp.]